MSIFSTAKRKFSLYKNLASIVVDAMGSCGSLSCDVMRCYNILTRHVLFETFPKLKLELDFGQNMSTLSELIGYVDLTDCHKIWQKHSEGNDEQNSARKV